MSDVVDVIVLGLGGMGSAAAAHLSARGARVLGLEQFTPAHSLGSSHGDTRVIRQAYFEHPAYVPLLLRAYALFDELDHDDPGLFVRTGGVMMGTADSATVVGSLASARQWGLAHELLDAAAIRARFPTFAPADDVVAVFEAMAGFVRPERTVRAHLRRAAAAGADLRFTEPAVSWTATPGRVTVRTARGRYDADRLVITPGAWAPHMLADLELPLNVQRQVLHWFAPIGGVTPFVRQPVFVWQSDPHHQLYGFPAVDGPDGGAKVAFFRGGAPADPDRLDRTVHPAEVDTMTAHLRRYLPTLAGPHLRAVACMYTTTPDEHFVVGTHPEHPNVVVAAGFSGHGFKFVPVVGEVLAELTLDGVTRHPIDLFDPGRFAGQPAA